MLHHCLLSLSSGDEAVKEKVWQDAMIEEYDAWDIVLEPTVQLVIDSKYAVSDEAFLEIGKYTLKVLENRDK